MTLQQPNDKSNQDDFFDLGLAVLDLTRKEWDGDMKKEYFTRTTYSFSPPNKETMDMLSFLCDKNRGEKINQQDFQQLINDLTQEAHSTRPSVLGV